MSYDKGSLRRICSECRGLEDGDRVIPKGDYDFKTLRAEGYDFTESPLSIGCYIKANTSVINGELSEDEIQELLQDCEDSGIERERCE